MYIKRKELRRIWQLGPQSKDIRYKNLEVARKFKVPLGTYHTDIH